MIIQCATFISRLAVIFAVLFTVIACGSSGSDSSFYVGDDDPPDQSVSLDALTSTTEGLLYSSLVTASLLTASDLGDSKIDYTGSIVVANLAQTMLDGVLVTPRETVIGLEEQLSPGTVVVAKGTSFIDDSGYLVSTTTADVTCIASSEAKLPESVNIGDSGVLSALTCDDDTNQDSNWTVDDAGEGNISLVIATTTIDQSNIIISTENTTFTLDSDGNIVSFKSVAIQSFSEYTLTIQSI